MPSNFCRLPKRPPEIRELEIALETTARLLAKALAELEAVRGEIDQARAAELALRMRTPIAGLNSGENGELSP